MAAMVIRRILTAEEPILRERARKVTQFDASLHRLRDDMLEITELINPQIVKASGEIVDWEGCLSIPGFVAEVTRSAKVTVKAKDRHGKEFRIKAKDLFARALQHEIDHLNGVLYIDYLESLEELVRVSEHAEIEEETTAGI